MKINLMKYWYNFYGWEDSNRIVKKNNIYFKILKHTIDYNHFIDNLMEMFEDENK